jgi:hypothetical protein
MVIAAEPTWDRFSLIRLYAWITTLMLINLNKEIDAPKNECYQTS